MKITNEREIIRTSGIERRFFSLIVDSLSGFISKGGLLWRKIEIRDEQTFFILRVEVYGFSSNKAGAYVEVPISKDHVELCISSKSCFMNPSESIFEEMHSSLWKILSDGLENGEP